MIFGVLGVSLIHKIIEGTIHETVLFFAMEIDLFVLAVIILAALVAFCAMLLIVFFESRGVCLWTRTWLLKKLPVLAAYSVALFSMGVIIYLVALGIYMSGTFA
jgi:hypothetical protein